MTKLTLTTIAFTVLATAAYAGGNTDEEQNGYMTRDPLPKAAPVIPDQYQIQEQVGREIFAKPQIKPTIIVDAPREEPVTIARAEPESECASFWQAAAELLGGDCYRDSNFHNPSPVGYKTVAGSKEVEVEKTDRFHKSFGRGHKGFYRALSKAKRLSKKGYKTKIGYTKKGGWKVSATKTYTTTVTVPTLVQVRADSVGDHGSDGTAGNSNGMRGSDIDSGNW